MDDKTADGLVMCLWTIFPRLFRLIRWRRGLRGGLSFYHYEIIGILESRESMSMSDICSFTGVSAPNLTPIVDVLVKKGFVDRIADEGDRRVVRVKLTTKGREVMRKGSDQTREEMKEVFSRFSNEELRELLNSFQKTAQLLSRLDDKEN